RIRWGFRSGGRESEGCGEEKSRKFHVVKAWTTRDSQREGERLQQNRRFGHMGLRVERLARAAHVLRCMNEATVRIPATTANLGPGYDCLGIALALANTVRVKKIAATAADGMPKEAADKFFAATGEGPFGFEWSIAGDVPQSRGMGSSVTVRLGLLHG